MKIYLTIAAVIAIFIVLFQGYLTMAANKSDEQPYKVIRIEKDFEIRLYPSVTMEMITASAKSYKELGYSGFRKGGMTSPVHMDIHDSASFRNPVTPPEFNKDNLPKPIDADVTIQSAIDEYVAVIKFGGFASDADIKSMLKS